ncbi:MAG TPA: DUF4412 domain-containing protein [Rhodanobacteraceae bacterium]|nr:DUF4412 domain-containing protein [Rhodanobacteraceae bacterium]
MRVLPFTLSLLAGAVFSVAHADVRLDYKASSKDAPLTRLEIAGSRMRSDSGGNTVVVDTANDEFLTIDRSAKEYTRIDAAQLEKLAGAASAAMQQVQAMLQNLPPDQRKMIEDRMGGRLPGAAAKTKVAMTPTGRHERIAGHDCEVYAMTFNGSHDQDLCLANAAEVGLDAADRKALHDAFAYFKRMAEKLSAGGSQLDLPFDQIGGDRVPIKVVVYDDGKPGATSQLESVRTDAIPASDFQPPAGFREKAVDLPGLGG